MRELKTWEMIEELTENPSKKFESRNFYDLKCFVYMEDVFTCGNTTHTECILIKHTGEKPELLQLSKYPLSWKWTEVIEPVDFITAYKGCKETGREYKGEKSECNIMYLGQFGDVCVKSDNGRITIDQLWIPID